jgi:uncharacterized membrane protein YeaQ/YmgE (transglycosylase-associated protein family)
VTLPLEVRLAIQILMLVIIGAAAGFIATRMMNLDLGVPQTIAIGVLGALAGGAILRFLSGAFGFLYGFAGAILGALLVVWLYQRVTGRR